MSYEIKIKDLKPITLLKLIRQGIIKAQEINYPEKVIASFTLSNHEIDRKKIDLIY